MRALSRLPSLLSAIVALGSLLATSRPARAQEGEPAAEPPPLSYPRVRGTTAKTLAFSGGGHYAFAASQGIPYLQGQIEYQVTNMLGVRASGGIPLMAGPAGTSVLPGQLGGTLHFRSRSTLDPYVGGSGGLAIVSSAKFGTKLVPLVSMFAGVRVYLTSFLFVQAEGGYGLMTYAGQGYYTDLNAPFVGAQGGFYL